MGITIKEFVKLSSEEKAKKYPELSRHDQFLWRTQYEPMSTKVVGQVERTEEEQAESRKMFREHLRKIGVLKDETD